MPPTTQAPTTLAPGNPIVPQRSPEDYRLIFSNPEGCIISDCDHFIGIDTNAGESNYLDIYMEGDAAGWVAVGFSETSDMVRHDHTLGSSYETLKKKMHVHGMYYLNRL